MRRKEQVRTSKEQGRGEKWWHFPTLKTHMNTTLSQVPAGKQVRVKFTMFRMKEPRVDVRVCHKDYIEVMGTK